MFSLPAEPNSSVTCAASVAQATWARTDSVAVRRRRSSRLCALFCATTSDDRVSDHALSSFLLTTASTAQNYYPQRIFIPLRTQQSDFQSCKLFRTFTDDRRKYIFESFISSHASLCVAHSAIFDWPASVRATINQIPKNLGLFAVAGIANDPRINVGSSASRGKVFSSGDSRGVVSSCGWPSGENESDRAASFQIAAGDVGVFVHARNEGHSDGLLLSYRGHGLTRDLRTRDRFSNHLGARVRRGHVAGREMWRDRPYRSATSLESLSADRGFLCFVRWVQWTANQLHGTGNIHCISANKNDLFLEKNRRFSATNCIILI